MNTQRITTEQNKVLLIYLFVFSFYPIFYDKNAVYKNPVIIAHCHCQIAEF